VRWLRLLFVLLITVASALAQTNPPPDKPPDDTPDRTNDQPEANPGRPTVSTPATLTPVGYFQFETGFLYARKSAEFSSRSGIEEVVKFSVASRLELLFASEPWVGSIAPLQPRQNAFGDISLGVQTMLHRGEGARPTISAGYFRHVYAGAAPDLDIGTPEDSLLLLISADVHGFHYDLNGFANRVKDARVRRLQTGQSLSVSHDLRKPFGLTGEIWHFTQPLQNGRTVGTLWALTYSPRRTLVFDFGFDRGLTATSTRWEAFAGCTYLLPHRLRPARASANNPH
jgi:hypothetical protein